MANKIKEKMASLSNFELKQILENRSDWQSEAIEAAEQELAHRKDIRKLIATLSDDELLNLLKEKSDNLIEYNIAEEEAKKRKLDYNVQEHSNEIDLGLHGQKILYFAPFGIRAIARFIDVTIIFIISLIIFGDKLIYIAPTLLFFFLYYPILESTGGTIGKRIFGIKTIQMVDRQSPSIFRSYMRAIFCLILSAIPIINLVSYLYLNKEYKQTWWDSGSLVMVVYKETPKSAFLSRS